MPENETLTMDLRKASRWDFAREWIENGECPNSVFPEVEKQFYVTLKSVFKQWNTYSVIQKDLFEAAANDHALLRRLVIQTKNHDYARLLRDVTVGQTDLNLGKVIGLFLHAVWEVVRCHLQADRRENGCPKDFLNQVRSMLDRIAKGLVKNPSRVPRRPPGTVKKTDLDDLLGESLLA